MQVLTQKNSAINLLRNKRFMLSIIAACVVATALILIVRGSTYSPNVSIEAEHSNRSGPTIIADSTASQGLGMRFSGASTGGGTDGGTTGGSLLKSATSFTKHSNLRYSNNSPRLLLDVYTPNHSGPFPLIVWLHGGAWEVGSKEDCFPAQNGMVQRGFAVACINYRYSSESRFPAQIQDVKTAIRWLRANGSTYKLFTGKIGIWGNSAGGHLAALAGTSGGSAQFDVGTNLNQSSAVQAVVDYWGPTDLIAFVQTPGFTHLAGANSAEARLLGGPVLQNQAKAQTANPLAYINAGDPPFLIYHGSRDGVVPPSQSQLLDAALKRAGLSSNYTVVQGAGHDLAQFKSATMLNSISAFYDGILR